VRIVHVASEVAPWAQTGGLGQVVGALPAALAAGGADVTVVAPLHRGVRGKAEAAGAPLVDAGIEVAVPLSGAAVRGRCFETRSGAARVLFVDCPLLYDRAGLYGDGGVDFPDNPFRFAFLAGAALEASARLPGGPPDVVHCHDWQTGLLPVYLAGAASRPRTVFTIHNLAFQGLFDGGLVAALGLPADGFALDGFEFFGKLSTLKAGCAFADAVTTVSPTYAHEITTPQHGAGLDGFFRHRGGVIGILNGIDTAAWDPATDPVIEATYSAGHLVGKAACRWELGDEMGLSPGGVMLGVVSRLTEQKGVDLIVELAVQLPELGARLVVLGSGDRELEDRLRGLAAAMPEHVAVRFGFDEALARRIFAGCEGLLMPSRFEPCGLAQMQAMRYGALPIVNPVGGLADTVDDPGDDGLREGQGTGFHMDRPDLRGLVRAVSRAVALHRDAAGWSRAVAAAMARDWSWQAPAERYLDLYRRL
jgi:starch synthase